MMSDCKLIIRLIFSIRGNQHPDTLLFGDSKMIIKLFHFSSICTELILKEASRRMNPRDASCKMTSRLKRIT